MPRQGKDLVKEFPDITEFVGNITKRTPNATAAFHFRRKKGTVAGRLFRVKGDLTQDQFKALLAIHSLPATGYQYGLNADWREFSLPLTIDDFEVAGMETYSITPDIDDVLSRLDLDDEDDEEIYRLFLNGREVKPGYNASLNAGEVLVIISDSDEAKGTVLPFSMLPTLKVYQEKLAGPYTYGSAAHMYPSELRGHPFVSPFNDDEVLCTICGKECRDHLLSDGDKFFVRKGGKSIDGRKGKRLYSIQSASLIATDATEALVPYAKVILGRRIRSDVWPHDISVVEIDDDDVTENTCGEEIIPGDTVSVRIADPRLKLKR